MGSQSEILFHEILDVQKILIGWTTFFFLALKFGQTSKKKTTLYMFFSTEGALEVIAVKRVSPILVIQSPFLFWCL